MASSHSSQSDPMDRLQQMERELERSQFQAQAAPAEATPVVSPTSEPSPETSRWGWGKTIGLVALVGAGLIVTGWILNLVGLLIKLALLGGVGYLLYRFLIAPRFKRGSSQ